MDKARTDPGADRGEAVCWHCRFAVRSVAEVVCHRYPPGPYTGDHQFAGFPVVASRNWCGEWQERIGGE